MNIDGKPFRTIWRKAGAAGVVEIIDQRKLPHEFVVVELRTVEEFRRAIRDMYVRGAGLIGATAGYGMHAAALAAPPEPAAFDACVREAGEILCATRPTASNLAWAVRRQLEAMAGAATVAAKIEAARQTADAIADEDAAFCRRIGEHGLAIIREIAARKNGAPVNILTHCNAGWLAFVDYGSATAPIYAAHDAGIPVHVWVDETRPRNQGASLTAWELGKHGVPHHLIVDNAGGHLMQHGQVDLVIVGTDRVTRNGDVANKIGTYLKALAAKDNGVPFYVALPSSTFDFAMTDGVRNIPIEERDEAEVRMMAGRAADGSVAEVRVCPESTPAKNYGFDVTPARLVTKLICERGVCDASEAGILALFPEMDEGYIKFSVHLTPGDVPWSDGLERLNMLRTELHDLRLVGVLPDGIGYGNVSLRCADSAAFVISGTATGGKRVLAPEEYCRVDAFDPATNEVWCTGRIRASSESMSHGAVYAAALAVNCVIHVHSRTLFDFMLAHGWPQTPVAAAFGTPAMAAAVGRLVRESGASTGVFATAGHDEGVIAYGRDVTEARRVLLDVAAGNV